MEKRLQITRKLNTLMFFSKTTLTTFLVFGLKLVLNMTFNLNETYFPEKFGIWRYLTSKLSKFGCFLTTCQSSQASQGILVSYVLGKSLPKRSKRLYSRRNYYKTLSTGTRSSEGRKRGRTRVSEWGRGEVLALPLFYYLPNFFYIRKEIQIDLKTILKSAALKLIIFIN